VPFASLYSLYFTHVIEKGKGEGKRNEIAQKTSIIGSRLEKKEGRKEADLFACLLVDDDGRPISGREKKGRKRLGPETALGFRARPYGSSSAGWEEGRGGREPRTAQNSPCEACVRHRSSRHPEEKGKRKERKWIMNPRFMRGGKKKGKRSARPHVRRREKKKKRRHVSHRARNFTLTRKPLKKRETRARRDGLGRKSMGERRENAETAREPTLLQCGHGGGGREGKGSRRAPSP